MGVVASRDCIINGVGNATALTNGKMGWDLSFCACASELLGSGKWFIVNFETPIMIAYVVVYPKKRQNSEFEEGGVEW